MLDVILIVSPLNLRANLSALLYRHRKNANLSAEILQILGLNLARKFKQACQTCINLMPISKILNLRASLNQTFVAQAFWGFFERLAHLLAKFDFARRCLKRRF